MSPTALEKSLSQSRRAQGLLRPLLEELFRKPVRIDCDADIDFINYVTQKMREREDERHTNSVFSPSGLSDCLRRVYLGRHWEKIGLERVVLPNVQTHGTFSNGEWVHIQWHFYMHKLDQTLGHKFVLIDVEIPVMSKRKDHGGTVDALAYLVEPQIPVVLDYKGWNVRNFQSALNATPHSARIQVTDYMMLLNSTYKWPQEVIEGIEAVGLKFPRRIRDGLILAINKGGPDPNHSLAMHEIHVALDDNLPDVNARLEVLRQHERQKEIPKPECTSTKVVQFQGCPFSGFCRKEVERIERRAKSRDSEKLTVSRPSRSNRSRRSRPK